MVRLELSSSSRCGSGSGRSILPSCSESGGSVVRNWVSSSNMPPSTDPYASISAPASSNASTSSTSSLLFGTARRSGRDRWVERLVDVKSPVLAGLPR
jgi:hypothetical protein